ncbi:MAG: YdcF family protein, partial [Bdellovibrionaceae bacterium]|nr:YdcF family protein [Pseudobdellovibrionaceae bacterium]
ISWPDVIYNPGLFNIHLESQSQTTYGNAQNSYLMLEKLQCHSFFLITSQTHMPRALLTFSKHHKQDQFTLIPCSVPASESETQTFALLSEVGKLLFYRFLFAIGFF